MRAADFFRADDPRDPESPLQPRVDLLERLRRGRLSFADDREAAEALTRLIHQELESYSTGNSWRLSNDNLALSLKALRATLRRINLPMLDVPFRDFAEYDKFCKREGMKGGGSYDKRRAYLDAIFMPLLNRLDELEEQQHESHLAIAVSPRSCLGWPAIDDEISQLRRRFGSATTEQDYNAVGVACVRILESLGDVVYDPEKHLRDGETPPPRDKTKNRLDRFIEVTLPGAGNEELRKLAKATVETAHQVKHRATPNRQTAGIVSDAVILLANMLRRLTDSE